MKDLTKASNYYGDDKVIDACSIFGMMDTSGARFSGADDHIHPALHKGGFTLFVVRDKIDLDPVQFGPSSEI